MIVPNYNHAAFLEQRLASVFNQTYQNLEIILLDDASTDGSVEILQKYANHPKVSHFIVSNENSGSPFRQWKKGIDLARGEYIWIAESDDFCADTFLESLIPLFKRNTVLVYCASNMMTSTGKVTGLDPWANGKKSQRWMRNYCNSGKAEIKSFLRYKNTIPNASAVIFKKEVVEKSNIPIDMFFCGDWYFWIQILKTGDIGFLSEPLNFFRNHSTSTRTTKNTDSEMRRFKEYFQVITSCSTIWSRIKNRRKYDWIINKFSTYYYLNNKVKIRDNAMPMDFKLRLLRMKFSHFFLHLYI